ncbi:NUDIX hydrolase [Rhabdochlamydiaceae symbiont of Dictyostelium giganteum]|uniref:NUDIX hydrolase n=1 Tax=Rhabdochlamydiaceae symbiont of Dictyostelium giganteum TaxID=3342349 RepID=UPI0038511DA1
MHVSVFQQCPPHFHPQFEAAGCYLEYEGSFLILKRHPLKLEGGKWCLPGGKLERGESPHIAAVRELKEETGVTVPSLCPVFPLYIQKPSGSFIFHLFCIQLTELPSLYIKEDEHTEGVWVKEEWLNSFELISGGEEILQLFNAWKIVSRT